MNLPELIRPFLKITSPCIQKLTMQQVKTDPGREHLAK
jgi:hypothetical protein